MPTPPKTAALVTGVCTASSWRCASIWAQSSRVGVRTSARVVRRGFPIRRCRIGRPKAAVFPLPVAAQARTSRPAMAGGIDCSWMGVGLVKPSSRTPRRRRGSRPKEEKGKESGPGAVRARLAVRGATQLRVAVLVDLGGGDREGEPARQLGVREELALQAREAQLGGVLE